jgi:signal transduction histidine kinase
VAVIDRPTVDDMRWQPWQAGQTSATMLPPVASRRVAGIVDVCFALVIILAGLPSVFGPRASLGPNHRLSALLLDFGLALPLIWRRRWPTEVFAVIAAFAFAQWLTGERFFADVALLVAFYTVAARESLRRTLAAAVVLEVGALLAALRWVHGQSWFLVFVLLSGMTTAAFFIGTNVRTRRLYLASVEDRAMRLELERDQQAQIVAAAERARIARDMHDIVAHNLSVMIALADGAALTTPDDPARAIAAMDQVSTTGRQALTEMRGLLGVLRDDQPAALQPQPGLSDIDTLLGQVRLVGLRGELITEGRPATLLPAGLQLTVYRLVQEALTNTLKHATEAETATVRIRFAGTGLDIEIVDDGAPVPAIEAGELQLGHGITGMRERAAVYGGTVEAGPRPSHGWRVRGSFDLAAHGLVS